MKLISVVIPCYNQGVYVEEAVESVLRQSYEKFEIVIVNDGSTDTFTNKLLERFERPRCRVLKTENRGLPGARNYGIKATSGEYICCLDADDMYHPEYFKKAAAVLDRDLDKRYGAVPAWVQMFGSCDTLWKTVGDNIKGFEPFHQAVRNNFQSATMFRRECWENIGGYDETMTLGYEDWDFWLRILNDGYETFCIEEPLIYYRQKEQSMVVEADEVRSKILRSIIRKNIKFYVNNLESILIDRDEEISLLKKKNQLLSECLSEKTDSRAKFLHMKHSTLLVSGRKYIKKIFFKT